MSKQNLDGGDLLVKCLLKEGVTTIQEVLRVTLEV